MLCQEQNVNKYLGVGDRGQAPVPFTVPKLLVWYNTFMNSILLINGSPRKQGNTSILLGEAKKVLARKGLKVKTIHLDSLRIKPCRGCNWCQKRDSRHCVQEDKMTELYRELLDCRGLVLGSPVYWDGVTAQMKIFIDRLFAMMKWKGESYKSLISGKRAILVLVAGGGIKDGLTDTRKMMRTVIKWCGFKRVGELIVPFMYKAGSVKEKPDVIQKIRLLAEKL